VVNRTPRRRPGFRARPHGDEVLGLSVDAVWICKNKPAFVICARLEIEDASGKAVRNDVLKRVLVDPFVADAEQWQACLEGVLAPLSVGHLDDRVAVVIAVDAPFESKGQQGRRFSDEIFCGGSIDSKEWRSEEEEKEKKRKIGARPLVSYFPGYSIEDGN
jgi:hypothetical protein